MWMSRVASEMAMASTPQSIEVLMSGDVARGSSRAPTPCRPRCAISSMTVALVAAHGRDAGLDLVDADLVEQLGDADLLVVGEDDAGGLLAVAQRRVVEHDRRLADRGLDGHRALDGHVVSHPGFHQRDLLGSWGAGPRASTRAACARHVEAPSRAWRATRPKILRYGRASGKRLARYLALPAGERASAARGRAPAAGACRAAGRPRTPHPRRRPRAAG